MATSILALPELSMPCTIESNMDWLDSIVFFDASGKAVPLDGIAFRLQVRVDSELPDVLVDASTDNGLLQILSAGFTCSLASPGQGYRVGDLIYVGGGTAVSPAVIRVTSVTVLSLGSLINYGGTSSSNFGYTVGQVITLTPYAAGSPISASAQVSIMVDSITSTGQIATYHVLNGGNYTVTPSGDNFLVPAPAGSALTTFFNGASYGIAGVVLADPGIYFVQPTSPAPQASTTGSGVSATFNVGQINNALGILIPAGDLVHPLIEAAGVYQIQAMADGYTQNVASGPMTVTQGIVR